MNIEPMKYAVSFAGISLGYVLSEAEAISAKKKCREFLGLDDSPDFVLISACIKALGPGNTSFSRPVRGCSASKWEIIEDIGNAKVPRNALYYFTAQLCRNETPIYLKCKVMTDEAVKTLTGIEPNVLAAIAGEHWGAFVQPPADTLRS
ncbi:hypothetical protein [Azospirillum soli]|uniref:hypothetical protein n=1 Tax=Azospirillum soli TaxID=1304799 RepID=UPI001AE178D1|nr:hypothetical protein [Azospirillum soli]MBP2312625.1 hypothetical protein [Azospirillum soli]